MSQFFVCRVDAHLHVELREVTSRLLLLAAESLISVVDTLGECILVGRILGGCICHQHPSAPDDFSGPESKDHSYKHC